MHIPVANRLGETKEYYFSKKLREIAEMNAQGAQVINLGIGSPDRPPHPEVIATLQAEAAKPNNHGYQSYKGAPQLREAFAQWYARFFQVNLNPNSEVLPLIGSKEGIMHLSMTFLNEGDEVLIPDPGYPSYRSAAQLAGATCRTYDLVEERNWAPDLAALEAQDLSRVKLMWINYPHMPTGTKADPEILKALVDFAKRHHILLCHDNPYSFILPDENQPQLSIFNIPGAKEVAVELNSLSKSHNMAGWRVGVMVADAEIIENVLRFKSNMDSGTFLPMQLAAAKALSLGDDWFAELNREYALRKAKAKALLRLLNCEFSDQQQGMFLWAKVPDNISDGYALSDKILNEAQVFITPGGIFGQNGQRFIRISLCSTIETIETAIERVSAVLKQHKETLELA